MFRRFVCIFLILIISICTLSSCGEDDGVAFVMPIDKDPSTLDPQIADSDSARLIISNCYEGLVRMNEKYELVPGVAESWEISPDGLTYKFRLRETDWQLLKIFSEVLPDENFLENFDTQVTASDFVFALRRAADPVTEAPDAEKLNCIKGFKDINEGLSPVSSLGVHAPDSKTLIIELERANPDFLRVLTLPVAMPCNEEFFKATRAKYGLSLQYTFCNGPFYLGRWVEENSMVLYRNEGYRGYSKVNPDAVYLYINDDEESVIKKLKQLSYDCAFISDDAHLSLADNRKVDTVSSVNAVEGLCFNCKDSTLQNENIRKALVMITKLDEINKSPLSDGQALGVVPDCCRFGGTSYREAAGKTDNLAYNEKEALKLWKKGLKELDTETAGITILCTEEYSSQLRFCIQNWQKLLGTSIVAKVEILSRDEIDTAVRDDSFQIAMTSIKSYSASPVDILKHFRSDEYYNVFNFSSKEYDAVVDRLINISGGNEIINDYRTAEKIITESAVFCPLFTYSDYIAVGREVTDVYPLPALQGICFLNGGRG